MKKYLLALVLAFSPFSGAVLAADSAPAPQSKPKDPALESARSAIEQKDWAAAQSILREANTAP